MKNILTLMNAALIVIAFSSEALAGGEIASNKINFVAFQTGGFFMYGDNWGNPNACTRSTAVVLSEVDPNYEKAYALLLSAYMAGKSISGYSDECVSFDGQTYNRIRGFKYLTVRN